MKTKLTVEKFESLEPCDDALNWVKSRKFDWQKCWEECDRGDWMIWVLRKTGKLDKTTAVNLAIACAEHVLHFYQKKNPKDERPAKAIQAAKNWLENPTEENRKAAAAAANAAYAAAAVYTAAYTAAYAAYTAYAAAYAAANVAAYAAYTAYTAAYAAANVAAAAAANAAYVAAAAAANAADARLKEWKWQADKIREIIRECPFKN